MGSVIETVKAKTGAAIPVSPESSLEVEPLREDPRWQLAERIVASKGFAKSALLSKFLLYVCDRQLRGRTEEITEQQIGVQVFGRRSGYNPGDDNIVRNYARLLRKRLDEYFEEEGTEESLRIRISRGGYVPSFDPLLRIEECSESTIRSAPNASEKPREERNGPSKSNEVSALEDRKLTEATPSLPQPVPAKAKHRFYITLAVCTVALSALSSFLILHLPNARTSTASHRLWTQLFNENQDTFIVPADSGLVILQNLTMHPVHLDEYVTGNYHSNPASPRTVNPEIVIELGTRRYTSVVDLGLVSNLARLPEVIPDRLAVRYARDLRMDDLKHSNAILLGSVDSNPWVELFQKDMNFRFEYQPAMDSAPQITNKQPLAGEKSVYSTNPKDPTHPTYGVIAFVPNLEGTGHVLLLEGLNMAGTQAAADFLLNEPTILPILQEATLPNNALKSFELLLETSNIGANASQAHVVARRFYPHKLS